MKSLASKFIWPGNQSDAVYSPEAERLLSKVIEWLPDEIIAWRNLGVTFSQARKFDQAIAAYGRAIELNPKSSSPHDGLGDVYRRSGRYQDALAAYGRAIELNPKSFSPHYGLGIVYQLLKQYGNAEEAFRKAVELNPQDGSYRSSLVGILRTLGREADATEQIKIARELIAKEGAYNRACFEAICGNSDEALAVLKMALERGEESLEWVEHDPDFDLLRDDPRFVALIEGMKARFAAG